MATSAHVYSTTPSRSLGHTPRVATTTAALLVSQFVLMMVPVVVLGRAINWPASLSEPASVVLPLIVAQRGAVAVGYFSYFLSALLLLPIALLLRRVFAQQDGALLTIATWFGAFAGVLKLFGISRWLLLMPALANSYVDPAATSGTRDTIAVVYDAFNRYAGGIGENLGVMLFAGVWTVLIALVLLRTARLPRWVGWSGIRRPSAAGRLCRSVWRRRRRRLPNRQRIRLADLVACARRGGVPLTLRLLIPMHVQLKKCSRLVLA